MKSKFLNTIGSLLMVGALAVTFAACGGGEKPSNTPGKRTHDQTTHVVTGSDKTLHHNFVDGKCTMCDETTIFMQEAVYKSMKNVLSLRRREKIRREEGRQRKGLRRFAALDL